MSGERAGQLMATLTAEREARLHGAAAGEDSDSWTYYALSWLLRDLAETADGTRAALEAFEFANRAVEVAAESRARFDAERAAQ